jgi:5-methyltetrahydrofolate--homocysteine methyltransferase
LRRRMTLRGMSPLRICWHLSNWFKINPVTGIIERKGLMSIMDDLRKSVIDGDLNATQDLVHKALAENIPPENILTNGLIAAMTEVGRMFENGEFYVPEMLISARAMKGGLAILRPQLAAANIQAIGRVILGTVQGDLHDIGKNLVGMMLEGAGFEVIDLGKDVNPDKFVAAVREHQPLLVGMSALITTTMPAMKETIDAISNAGLRSKVKIMVGGAPVTSEYAREIGADYYGPDSTAGKNYARSVAAGKA